MGHRRQNRVGPTQREREVLEIIARHNRAGITPTRGQVADELGVKASTVTYHVSNLHHSRYLRGYRVTPEGEAALG